MDTQSANAATSTGQQELPVVDAINADFHWVVKLGGLGKNGVVKDLWAEQVRPLLSHTGNTLAYAPLPTYQIVP